MERIMRLGRNRSSLSVVVSAAHALVSPWAAAVCACGRRRVHSGAVGRGLYTGVHCTRYEHPPMMTPQRCGCTSLTTIHWNWIWRAVRSRQYSYFTTYYLRAFTRYPAKRRRIRYNPNQAHASRPTMTCTRTLQLRNLPAL